MTSERGEAIEGSRWPKDRMVEVAGMGINKRIGRTTKRKRIKPERC